jgi:hypothetical protein
MFFWKRREDIASGNQIEPEVVVALLYLPRGNVCRFVVSDSGAHHEHIAFVRMPVDSIVHFIAGENRNEMYAPRPIQVDWAGNQSDFVSSLTRCFSDGVSHFS